MPRRAAASPRRQRGAVAILVGLSIFVLIGFLGLVMDLGRLYIAKTELQNAADAAALSGAKELNGSVTGITAAVNRAFLTASQNGYDFGKIPVSSSSPSSDLIISVGNCPDDACMVPVANVTNDAQAANKFFIKADTGLRDLGTLFMRVFNTDVTRTLGVAVAGSFMSDITPLGVCAINPGEPYAQESAWGELIEYGFRRGMAYDISTLNTPGLSGLPQDPFWINPVDRDTCDPSHSSTNYMTSFVCSGKSSSIANLGQSVFINTGTSSSLERALNSRFDLFQGNICDPASAPPDTNIKEYSGNPGGATGQPRDWMNPDPSSPPPNTCMQGNNNPQTVCIDTTTNKPVGFPGNPSLPSQFGVLWSFNPAVRNNSGVPGAAFDLRDWNDATNALYLAPNPPTFPVGLAADLTPGGVGYPDPVPQPTPGTPPYRQTSGKYFEAPVRPGVAERRVLNVAIIKCNEAAGGAGACKTLPVIGIGRFFLQRAANFGGGNKRIEGEFAGTLSPADIKRVIRLYR